MLTLSENSYAARATTNRFVYGIYRSLSQFVLFLTPEVLENTQARQSLNFQTI